MNEKVLEKNFVSVINWFKITSLVFVLGNSFACQTYSQQKIPVSSNPAEPTWETTPTKESKKMSQDYIKALQQHDSGVLDKAKQAPKDLPKDIDSAISNFDEEARELAVELIFRQDNQYSGRFMLRRLNDPSPNVATKAMRAMTKIIHKPKTDDILATIPTIEAPFIRGKLYLEIGTRKEQDLLGKLRSAAADEKDKKANRQSLAALVKLGGKQEKTQLLEIVRAAKPEEVLEIQDLLLYIDDPTMAKGLIPWLGNKTEVTRLGGDRQEMMERMCDSGVWIVRMLKIELPFETAYIRNFTEEEIEQTRKIIELLP